jgi:hypothetical protein
MTPAIMTSSNMTPANMMGPSNMMDPSNMMTPSNMMDPSNMTPFNMDPGNMMAPDIMMDYTKVDHISLDTSNLFIDIQDYLNVMNLLYDKTKDTIISVNTVLESMKPYIYKRR